MSETPQILDAGELRRFSDGRHLRLWELLGAHPVEGGTRFAVWAPNAASVSVIGDFNDWQPGVHPLAPQGASGVWAAVVPAAAKGAHYKYHLVSRNRGMRLQKADPLGFRMEAPPETASQVWTLEHAWGDAAWLQSRQRRNALDAPMSIYEVHLGSWMRKPGNEAHTYAELAPRLVAHVKELGFTHVELLPVMEHPFYGSWGYQVTGYFAASARYGTPQDLMSLIDQLHQAGIGVILDWVPAHFPREDAHGLAFFDGTHLYEHADPRQGLHPDWNTAIFNYGRHEVRSFLLSSALFWLEVFHADGLRVDGVASMLYLDYSRKQGEWIPNRLGGRENLEAISFLKELNRAVYATHPDVQTIAEESTAWPRVSRPLWEGGLGFGLKWDMGWMHDTLEYLSIDPLFRGGAHRKLTFRQLYARSENFVLPLSHDEVVHGKRSLLSKMPGDAWQKRANLRLLLAWQWAQPGKKLLFMGGELGAVREWNHDEELPWALRAQPEHAGIGLLLAELNRLYTERPALHAGDFTATGFEWIDCDDAARSVVSLLRRGGADDPPVVAIFNFTPVPHEGYRLGLPAAGTWREVLCTDAERFGGSGVANAGPIVAEEEPMHGRAFSALVRVPPLGAAFFELQAPAAKRKAPARATTKGTAKVEAKPAAKVEAKPAAKVEAKPAAKVSAKPAASKRSRAPATSKKPKKPGRR